MASLVHDHARWGTGDQIGAANHLSPEVTLAALGEVREGRVLGLSQPISHQIPHMAPFQSAFVMTNAGTPRNRMRARAKMGATNEIGSIIERIGMTTHVGTHMDALGHITIGDRMYGGYSADETLDDLGLANLGIEHCPPIVTREVLLDVSRLDGGDHLASGRPVTADDLARVADDAGVMPQKGDVVFINTGWGKFYMTDNARYIDGEPGIDVGAAKWLTDKNIVAIGADNMAVEVMPHPQHPELVLPVHQHCLVEHGVYLIENMRFDAIVAAGRPTFCLMAAPVPFCGASGAPVSPVAIV